MVVCVSSFLLGDFMIQAAERKSTGQNQASQFVYKRADFSHFSFIIRSKNIIKVHIDKTEVPC